MTGPLSAEVAIFALYLEYPDAMKELEEDEAAQSILAQQRLDDDNRAALPGGTGYRGERATAPVIEAGVRDTDG